MSVRRLVYLATQYIDWYDIADTKCSKEFVYTFEYSYSGIGYPIL